MAESKLGREWDQTAAIVAAWTGEWIHPFEKRKYGSGYDAFAAGAR